MYDVANALAIVAFVIVIAVEVAWGRARARRRRSSPSYAFHDSITNVSLGLGSLLFGTITVLQGFAVHRYLDDHCALITLPTASIATWVFVMVVVDLAFYASHRAMHRVNLLWTAHAVHHQSEQLNLLVALRIGWCSVFFSWLFYLPLAPLGVTLEMSLIARAISSLYQFGLHTTLIGKLGPLEAVLVTPSHHRVHHAINPRYLDRNHGGMLIVWDRLFGTFAEEQETPVYGTTRPLASFNPIWANLVEWVRLGKLAWRTPRWRDKLQLWFRPPAWQPREPGGPREVAPPPRLDRTPYDVTTVRWVDRYVAVNVALVLGAGMLSMIFGAQLSSTGFVVFAIELVAAMVVWGGLIERRRWARWLEGTRLASLAIVAIVVASP